MSDSPPIPAATLIVVRDRAGAAPELLIVERAPGMAFAGGALVFPGGRIDDGDRALASAVGDPDSGARVAAIREAIEETAVPVAVRPTPPPSAALEMQQALIADHGFADVLRKCGVALDCATLVPLARWVPKFHVSRRFDTMFFVARAPDGDWRPNAAEGECTGAFWLSAAEVLERDRAGDARLIFPTRRTLERLAQHGSFDAIAADAAAYPIEPITPWVEEVDGESFIAIAGDIGFPIVREKLDTLWRG